MHSTRVSHFPVSSFRLTLLSWPGVGAAPVVFSGGNSRNKQNEQWQRQVKKPQYLRKS